MGGEGFGSSLQDFNKKKTYHSTYQTFHPTHSREVDLVRYMVRLVATFPSSYSKPPGSVNMRELLKKMKNFYKLKSLQV